MNSNGVTRLVGGHAVADFVNTVRWRLDPARRDDSLHTMSDALHVGVELSLLTDKESKRVHVSEALGGDPASLELQRLKQLRESLRSTLLEGAPCEILEANYRQAVTSGTLHNGGTRWTWTLPSDVQLLRLRLALSAEELLRSATAGAVRQCEDEHCGWIYLDRSPRHNRRWCSSDDCGNRNRVRQHYRRARTDGLSAPSSPP